MSIYPPLPAELPPQRGKYVPQYFVGRGKEVEDLTQKIEEGLANRPITDPVVHLWGAPGIGKSWLMQHLCWQTRQLSSKLDKDREKRGALCALVDLASLRLAAQEPLSIAKLLQKIHGELRSHGGVEELRAAEVKFLRELEEVQEARGRLPASELVGYFIDYLTRLSEDFVVVLLLDAVENVSPDDFSWLERKLLAPLAGTGRILVVVAGRREIPHWKDFNVRRRLDRRELSPFDAATTESQLLNLDVPPDEADDVYRYTFGHPYANQAWGVIRAQQGEVVAGQLAYLLGQVEGELLREVFSTVDKDILRSLATLRKLNIESARRLLGRVLDEEYRSKSDGDYLRIFKNLEKTNLVHWDSKERGYMMDPSVRRIIDLRIQHDDVDLFRERHAVARELYEEWFEDNPIDRGALLLEILYHLCRANADRPASQVKEQVVDVLEERLSPEHLSADNVNALSRSFQADSEFKGRGSLIPPEAVEEIERRVEELHLQVIDGSL
jgi:hypothetical protein